jgi:hypothetical protein
MRPARRASPLVAQGSGATSMLANELQKYAAVVAGMAVGTPRQSLLAREGLSEAEFDALEQRVETELSAAMDSGGDGPPPFLVAYEAALRKAQDAALPKCRLSLEEFAHAVGAIERSTDPRHTLEKLGLAAHDISAALAHYGPRLARDSELAKRFVALREGKRGKPSD